MLALKNEIFLLKANAIGLIKVFGAIFTGRQISGQKLQRLYGHPMANNLFQSNFTKFVNCYVKILGERFYSPSLKDKAWL